MEMYIGGPELIVLPPSEVTIVEDYQWINLTCQVQRVSKLLTVIYNSRSIQQSAYPNHFRGTAVNIRHNNLVAFLRLNALQPASLNGLEIWS